MIRHPNVLKRDRAALLVIDVQEKFAPVISNMDQVEHNLINLIKGCDVLKVPVIYTEQYPKGLGNTIPSLAQLMKEAKRIEKKHFSICFEKELMLTLQEKDFQQLILAGIETHICVLQSALDLTREGFQVHVVADATGSRSPANRELALQRLQALGVTVTSTESALFELTEVSGTDEFKAISRLLK